MRIAAFVVAAGLALAGSVALAQAVTYDFDRTADFSKFKTYTWVQGTRVSDELNHERVVNAIDSQLARKGFGKVDSSGGPDVLVAYHIAFEKDVEFNGSSTGWGPYGLGGNRRGTVRAQEILVGTLTVEMMNAASNKVVWRGVASMDIDRRANPEKREKSINKAAEKIFKNYPRAS
jgi:uncharacterized protein DUF4136